MEIRNGRCNGTNMVRQEGVNVVAIIQNRHFMKKTLFLPLGTMNLLTEQWGKKLSGAHSKPITITLVGGIFIE